MRVVVVVIKVWSLVSNKARVVVRVVMVLSACEGGVERLWFAVLGRCILKAESSSPILLISAWRPASAPLRAFCSWLRRSRNFWGLCIRSFCEGTGGFLTGVLVPLGGHVRSLRPLFELGFSECEGVRFLGVVVVMATLSDAFRIGFTGFVPRDIDGEFSLYWIDPNLCGESLVRGVYPNRSGEPKRCGDDLSDC